MQKWRHRLKKGMALALAAVVIGGAVNVMTMPVLAENEAVSASEKKEQVDFHFPESKVTVVEKDPDFTVAAEGAAEGSTVTYSSDHPEVAIVDNNGTVHLNREGGAVITAIASETEEYKSKEISYELHVLGYCPQDAVDAVTDKTDGNVKFEIEDWKDIEWKEEKWTAESNETDSNLDNEFTLSVKIPVKVPDALKEKFDTMEKVKEKMVEAMQSVIEHVDQAAKFVEDPVIYDVKLMTSDENGKETEVTAENFPKEGITITIPYPAGVDKDKYDFVVSHMFTHSVNGNKPGTTECPKVTKGLHGLTFKVMGLSPISIGWVEAQSEESVKKAPQVVGDTFVWENGGVKVPIDYGDYAAEDVYININNTQVSVEDNTAVLSISDFYRFELEKGHPFSKKGEYEAEVSFRSMSDYSEISANKITIQVLADETDQLWKAEQKTAKFDGSQDVTFSFANGTGIYALQSVNELELFAWKFLEINGERQHNISLAEGGYTYDMDTGSLTIDKDALSEGLRESMKIWEQAGEDISDYPQLVGINAYAATSMGASTVFSTIMVSDPQYGTYEDSGWKLDVSDFDVAAPSQIEVAEESIAAFTDSVRSYVEKEYAEKLSELNGNYEVVSRLEVQDASAVNTEVKDIFTKSGNGTIGQYYDIRILADVVQNGVKVEGLENIAVSKLDKKITINLQIPENIRKSGRIYRMLHYNNETKKVEVLQSKTNNGVISFETDSFSPYALAYNDSTTSSGANKPSFSNKDDNSGNQNQENPGSEGSQGNTSTNQPNNTNQSNNSGNQLKNQNTQNNSKNTTPLSPKTGDSNNMGIYVVLLGLSVMTIMFLRKHRML